MPKRSCVELLFLLYFQRTIAQKQRDASDWVLKLFFEEVLFTDSTNAV